MCGGIDDGFIIDQRCSRNRVMLFICGYVLGQSNGIPGIYFRDLELWTEVTIRYCIDCIIKTQVSIICNLINYKILEDPPNY